MPRYQREMQKKPVVYTPPQVQKSTFGDSMKDGFGFGMGSAVAHSLVNRIMTPKPPSQNERCAAYYECLKVIENKANCDRIFKTCSEQELSTK